MYRLKFEKGVKVNIWLNEKLAAESRDSSKIIMEGDTNILADSKKLIVELSLPRAHDNYALLGADLLAYKNGKSIIKWGIDCLKHKRYSNAIALPFDTVFWGIMEEFEEGIRHSLDNHRNRHMLPSGIITYNISAYGEIGSSADMFRRVNDILLSLLICDKMSETCLAKIVQEKIDFY